MNNDTMLTNFHSTQCKQISQFNHKLYDGNEIRIEGKKHKRNGKERKRCEHQEEEIKGESSTKLWRIIKCNTLFNFILCIYEQQ